MVFGVLALLIIMLFSSLSSCSVMMEGAMGSILGTSYTSEDPDILQTETNYTALESQLRNELSNIENTYSGYDEYRYDVDNICLLYTSYGYQAGAGLPHGAGGRCAG